MSRPGTSWGRYPPATQQLLSVRRRDRELPAFDGHALPYGSGRSYGDVCLNDGGTLLLTRGLDRFIAFDADRGLLRCEAGTTLGEIDDLCLPHGWALPVVPGTRHVTVGGAIANDVHGKNHHRVGSFGDHVRALELLRSDGRRIECGPDRHADWFAATVGGLGLTGLITWAELALRRTAGPWVESETLAFSGIGEFLALSAQSADSHEYTVAWVDCAVRGTSLGRGLFTRANPVAGPIDRRHARRVWRIPFTLPVPLVNRYCMRAFNALYFRHGNRQRGVRRVPAARFLYPLDALGDWNRLYGPRGFVQYQCVVPMACAEPVLNALLARIAASGSGSFLAVLKVFGDRAPVGLLSFARHGVTLALDFPLHGAGTLALLDALDAEVSAAGGAVYPAKDARMSAPTFRHGFPRWEDMRAHLDPRFSSGFWRRVGAA